MNARTKLLVAAMGLLATACAHRVTLRRGSDFSVFETPGARIYLSSAFLKGFMEKGSAEADQDFYRRSLDELGTLIDRRVVTGRMFLHALGDAPPDTGVRVRYRRDLSTVDEVLATDSGPLLKILYYEDESDPLTPTNRKYDLWVTFDPAETGWGSFHHFTLTLENPSATRATTPRDFALHARLTALTYEGIEL